MAQSYMILEEKLNTQFNNLTSTDANSIHPMENESHRWKDETDQGIQGRCEKYMSLNAFWEKIYEDCANTESRKGGIRPSFPIRESPWIKKLKY